MSKIYGIPTVTPLVPGATGGGVNGKSAYELAVSEGYEGTLTEWLDSLVGPQGERGERGPQGASGADAPIDTYLPKDGSTSMAGDLSMGGNRITNLGTPVNEDDAVRKRDVRPAGWTPTALEVGARPDTWMPTAEEVGARPDTWIPTADQVGARPNTWTPTAEQVGAAPSGYGLGEGGVYSSDVGLTGPNLARGGFFRWDSLGQSNGYPFVYGTMLVVPRVKDSSSFMLAYCHADSYKGTIAVKRYASGAETNWEYINPPMALGVEYLTTERYNGKPVYVKASELDLVASGSKFAHIYASISDVVSIDGSVYRRSDSTIVPIATYASNIAINMYGNFIWNVTENSLARVIVKYTKQ